MRYRPFSHLFVISILILSVATGSVAGADTTIKGDTILTNIINATKVSITDLLETTRIQSTSASLQEMQLEPLANAPYSCTAGKHGSLYYNNQEGLCLCSEEGWECAQGGETIVPGAGSGKRRVFVTSKEYEGNLGGIQGANEKCQQRADAANLDGNFHAWISTSSINAKENIGCVEDADLEFWDVKLNNRIANSCDDLTDGSLQTELNVNENGKEVGYYGRDYPWTGTQKDGTAASNTCNDWTVGTSYANGYRGRTDQVDHDWTYYYSAGCSGNYPLYCFEQ